MVGKRYRILETLGKGAFGTVYRAEVLGAGDFKKQVALKVLDYQGEAPEEIQLRFRDEARILGLIRHRAVVGVDSLAELETGWAVVMEYVHGVNVSAVVKYGLPPARVVVSIVEEVSSALHAAWTTTSDTTGEPLRLVHRDIKPANIRLTAQGEVKVLDFGVARAEFESREANTQAMRFGSLRYMAPESFDGIEGHATDVFALGVVFGELLAGKRLEEPPKNPARYDQYVDAVLTAARDRLQAQMPKQQLDQILNILGEMISFEPEGRPSARTIERTCRRLAHELTGPTLRDWSEEYVPALSEKLARRRAQKEAGDSPSSEVLIEKSTQGHVLDSPLPSHTGSVNLQDGTLTRGTGTAAIGGAMFGAGAVLIAIAAGALVLVGGSWYLMNPSVRDRGDGVAQLDAQPDPEPDKVVEGEGTDLDLLEGLPETEYFEIVDPDDPTRTIVIARADVQKGTSKETITIVDPEDETRTIVIARRSVQGRTAPPPPPEPEGTAEPDPVPAPQPTKVTVRPKPDPAPAPGPGSAHVPKAVESGGTITVSGDAKSVAFISDGGRFSAGGVPIGTYRIMASFGADEIQAGTVTVRDGEAVRVDCQQLMLRCSRK